MPADHGAALLQPAPQRWHCPACGATTVTTERRPHTQLHPCPKARGVLVPYLPAGTGGKITVLERQDYEQHGGLRRGVAEDLRRDENDRPVMGVQVEYDGGTHTALFVPGILINLGQAT